MNFCHYRKREEKHHHIILSSLHSCNISFWECRDFNETGQGNCVKQNNKGCRLPIHGKR